MNKNVSNEAAKSNPSEGTGLASREASSLGPFQHKVFRAIWIATVVSNVGTWMHEVGAAWLMTAITPDPFMVAMIQTATALPIFIFALPAGALADIVDRRRHLLIVQITMLFLAILLALLTWAGLITPWMLIVFTFLLGCGAAFNAPAWQAITPELVPQNQLTAAVALNSIGINVARAIGPALGGVLVALHGPVLTFALNAATFVGIILILFRWRREQIISSLPAERFFNAIRSGLRYAGQSSPIQIVAIRASAFFFFASAIWALLPLVAKIELQQGAGGFGLLLGAIGLGAVAGATQLPRLKKYLSSDHMVMTASVFIAVCTVGLAFAQYLVVTLAFMVMTGMAWIIVLSSLNVAAQLAAPTWVRARVLSVYLVVFYGNMAIGSGIWGQLAKVLSITDSLLIAGVGQILGIVLTARYRLRQSEGIDNTPSGHWPVPIIEDEPELDRGPVLITIEYHVEPDRKEQFIQLMRELRRVRKRDGAFYWSVFSDVANPGRIIETFMTESWLEHLRQHERVTNADRVLQESISNVSTRGQPAVVRHYVAIH